MKHRLMIVIMLLAFFVAPAAFAQKAELLSTTNVNSSITSGVAWAQMIELTDSNWAVYNISARTGWQQIPKPMHIEIRLNNSGATNPNGTVLCTSTDTDLDVEYAPNAKDFNFSFPGGCDLSEYSSGQKLWIVGEKSNATPGNIGLAGNFSGNEYPDGNLYRWDGSSWIAQGLNDDDQNLKLYGQEQGIFACGNFTTPTLSALLFDEENSSSINGSIDISVTYNISSTSDTTETKTFSFDNKHNASLCLSLPLMVYEADFTITASTVEHVERVIKQSDIILSKTLRNENVYLLKDTSGLFARFNTVDSFDNPISGVTATMTHPTLGLMETRTTDAAGIATFWADSDTTYNFTFSKTGFSTKEFDLRPTTTDVVTVKMAEGFTETESFFKGITYTLSPSNAAITNGTAYNFTFNLTSSLWNITACHFYLKNATQTLTSAAGSFNDSRCDVNIEFNVGNQSRIISSATYRLNGTANFTVSKEYSIDYYYVGNFSLKVFIDDLSNFSGAGFNGFSRMFLALLFIVIASAWASKEAATFRDEKPLLILIWFLVMFFSYIGWLNLPLTSIPDVAGLPIGWLNDWMIFIMVSLGIGAYLLNKG